ncbi:hypothetical protein DFH08DRAFT_825882 [Mycena albidolilacea]|uniref:Uncharacterized protein n=1 Tax=Mycena albidolilacea TaxID=1033008 RepID=A0AAD6Z255_9AGAR|nr:hypothetical protein DFH08DRAFT_825882 [Mycena albidolilacea]
MLTPNHNETAAETQCEDPGEGVTLQRVRPSQLDPDSQVNRSLAAAAGHRWLLAAAAGRCLAASITEARQWPPVTGGPSYRPLAGFHWFLPEGAGCQQGCLLLAVYQEKIHKNGLCIQFTSNQNPMVSSGISATGFGGVQRPPVDSTGTPVPSNGCRHQPMPTTADQPVAISAHITAFLFVIADDLDPRLD